VASSRRSSEVDAMPLVVITGNEYGTQNGRLRALGGSKSQRLGLQNRLVGIYRALRGGVQMKSWGS
jgi:hypothetical protein